MFSSLPSTWRLRTRSCAAFLLALSAAVLILRGGYFQAVATGAFAAAAHLRVPASAVPAGADRAAAKMGGSWLAESFINKVDYSGREANEKAATEMRAAFEARNNMARKNDEEKRGFLGRLIPGKEPKIWDIIADPNIAFDARYPMTPELENALKTRKEFAARNPLTAQQLDEEDQRNAQAIPFLKPDPQFES